MEDRKTTSEDRKEQEGGVEREVEERESGQCLSAQTGDGLVGSAHHL